MSNELQSLQSRGSKSCSRRWRWRLRFSLTRLLLIITIAAMLLFFFSLTYGGKATTEWISQSVAKVTLIEPSQQSIWQRVQVWCGNSLPAVNRVLIDDSIKPECVDELLSLRKSLPRWSCKVADNSTILADRRLCQTPLTLRL